MQPVQPMQEATTIRIAPMRRRHLRSVLKIETAVYPRPWSTSLFLSELAMKSSRAYFVAFADQKLVGYVGLMMNMDEGHITTIAVDPKFQRRYIGARLLLVAVRDAAQRHAKNLTLEVRMQNHEAQALYRQFGFSPVGVRKNYYPETNEDAMVMWAHDVELPEYAERLAAIERRIPGGTLVEEVEPW